MEITYFHIVKGRCYAVGLSEDYIPEDCLQDDKGNLLLDRDYCDQNQIKKGTVLTYEELDKHCYLSAVCRAKSRALWLLEGQDYPSGKLMQKLRKLYSFEVCKEAINRLTELGVINDQAYAQRMAQALINKGISKSNLPYALSQKGIDLPLAKQVASELTIDDQTSIDQLIKTKYKNRLSNKSDLNKTITSLMRKGFKYEDIKASLGDIIYNVADGENNGF